MAVRLSVESAFHVFHKRDHFFGYYMSHVDVAVLRFRETLANSFFQVSLCDSMPRIYMYFVMKRFSADGD